MGECLQNCFLRRFLGVGVVLQHRPCGEVDCSLTGTNQFMERFVIAVTHAGDQVVLRSLLLWSRHWGLSSSHERLFSVTVRQNIIGKIPGVPFFAGPCPSFSSLLPDSGEASPIIRCMGRTNVTVIVEQGSPEDHWTRRKPPRCAYEANGFFLNPHARLGAGGGT